jgi:hypothetical protein
MNATKESFAGAGICSECSHVVSSAAVPVLWNYVRVISILSALSISQVPVCLVCHAAAVSNTTHYVEVVAGSGEPCVRKGVRRMQQKAVKVPAVSRNAVFEKCHVSDVRHVRAYRAIIRHLRA